MAEKKRNLSSKKEVSGSRSKTRETKPSQRGNSKRPGKVPGYLWAIIGIAGTLIIAVVLAVIISPGTRQVMPGLKDFDKYVETGNESDNKQSVIEELLKTVEVDSNRSYSEYLQSGKEFYGNDKLDSAEYMLMAAIKFAPDSAEAYGWLGNILLSKGETLEAKELLQQGREINPDETTIRYTLGNLLLEEEKYDGAEIEFQALIDLSPSGPIKSLGYNGLGSVFFRKGEFKKAEDEYRKAKNIFPTMPYPHANLAQVLLMQGKNKKEAENELRTAIRRYKEVGETTSPVSLVLLGTLRLEQNDSRGAEEYYRQALESESTYYYAHYYLGVLNYKEGNYGDAESRCREAIRWKPNYPIFHIFLGGVLDRKGDLVGAEDEFRLACDSTQEQTPETSEVAKKALFVFLIKKGVTEYRNVNFKEALKTEKNVLKQLEDTTLFRREVADSLKSKAHFLIGNIHMQKGAYRKAKRSYDIVLELDPKNKDALYNLARTYLSLRKFNQAQLAAATARMLGADSAKVDVLLKLIKESRAIVAGGTVPSLKTDSQKGEISLVETEEEEGKEQKAVEKEEGQPKRRVRLRWWQFIPLVVCLGVVGWIIFKSFKNKAPEFLKPLLLIFVPLFFLFAIVFVAYPIVTSLDLTFGEVGSIAFDLTRIEPLPPMDPDLSDIKELSNISEELEEVVFEDIYSYSLPASGEVEW